MKIEITEKKDNPLLSRQEVKGTLTFNTATPSNDELQANLAKQLNVDKECIRMKKIATRYGISKADFLAFVYTSKEELEKIEPAPKKWVEKQEKKAEAAKKKAEEKKEAKSKEEAPKEAKKEEKAEEKPAEKAKEAPKTEEKKEGDK
jgi:ribosomal protein S24E